MYTGCLYLLNDGDKISEEVAPNRGLKQGWPLSSLLYSLYNNDMDRFLTIQRGAATALDSVQILHCDWWSSAPWWYAETLLSLQTRLKVCISNWTNSKTTCFKGLKLNTDKTKFMVFISRTASAITTFTYYGTPLELVTEFKYLVITLTRDGSMLSCWEDSRQLQVCHCHLQKRKEKRKTTQAVKTTPHMKLRNSKPLWYRVP